VIEFQRTTILPVAPESAFDLSLSIDAHAASMVRSDERAVAGVTTGTIGRDQFVTWKARHFGVTWTMTSEITAWDRPHRFVDEQVKGPFRSFWHEHVFTPVLGATQLDDRVRFVAPLGPLGTIAERLVLGRYLAHLIDVRNEFLLSTAQRR
jgi:ligand-binding SRPBCC domain-containing protein